MFDTALRSACRVAFFAEIAYQSLYPSISQGSQINAAVLPSYPDSQ